MIDAGAGGEPLSSLKPYQALRSLYDSYVQSTTQGWLAGEMELAEVLRGDASFPAPTRVPNLAEATTPDERVEAIKAFLVRARLAISKVRDLRVGNRADASDVPVIRDLADDILWALEDLDRRLVTAAIIPASGGEKLVAQDVAANDDVFEDVL